MFRSWFPRGIFSWKSTQNRIDSLYTNAEDVPHNKVFSPTLQDLQNQKNKVKEMSSNYEELHLGGDTPNCSFQASIHNTKCRKASLVEGPDEEGDQMNVTFSQLTMEAPVGEDGKASLKDIIVSEEKYIKLQELMIAKYVREFETESGFILSNETSIIKRQKEELFGPIEAIYRFHKEEFQPMLVSCGDDVMLFATSLSKMCKDGAFNIYLIYAMDEKLCEYRRNIYFKSFIDEIMMKVGLAYDFFPIQQLKSYHGIIMEMLKEIPMLPSSDEFSALAEAEHEFQLVLHMIDEFRKLPSDFI